MTATYITGTIDLSDGTETHFSLTPDLGWQQWGNTQDRLGATVDLMDALAAAASEFFIQTEEEV